MIDKATCLIKLVICIPVIGIIQMAFNT